MHTHKIPPHALHIKKHKRNTVKTVSRCVCVELAAWWPISRCLTLTSPAAVQAVHRGSGSPSGTFSFFWFPRHRVRLFTFIYEFHYCRHFFNFISTHAGETRFSCGNTLRSYWANLFAINLSFRKKIDVHDLGVYWCGYDGTVFGNLYFVSFYYVGKYRKFEVETLHRSWFRTLAETIVV